MLAGFWGTVDVSDAALASIPAPMRQALRAEMVRGARDDEQKPEW
jgi:hypothetical protein